MVVVEDSGLHSSHPRRWSWPEAGSDPLPAEGLLPLGPDWTGVQVSWLNQDCLAFALPILRLRQRSRRCGVLGDLNWERAGPGCALSYDDVTDARDYRL